MCTLTRPWRSGEYCTGLHPLRSTAWQWLAPDADSQPSVAGISTHVDLQAVAEAAAARQEAQASKADSVALVERLHYVQGYQRTGRRKGGPQGL